MKGNFQFLESVPGNQVLNNIPCEFLQGVLIKSKQPFKRGKIKSATPLNLSLGHKKIEKSIINKVVLKTKSPKSIDKYLIIVSKLLDDTFYYINQKNHDTFSSSLFTLLDDDFHLLKPFSKTSSNTQDSYIKKAKQKMAIDLIEENLYRKFNYHHTHSFKKSKLEDNLQENKIVSKNEKRYFGDYFDLNILILDWKKNSINLVSEEVDYNKISVIMFYDAENEKYYPILSNTGNHFIHPNNLVNLLKKFKIENKDNNKKTETKKFKKIELSKTNYKQNKLGLYNISRYTLKDLQTIAEDYEIETHKLKVNKKGETKQKPKTKKELYDIIKSKYSI